MNIVLSEETHFLYKNTQWFNGLESKQDLTLFPTVKVETLLLENVPWQMSTAQVVNTEDEL